MERLKRPKLDRTTPIRSWSALLGIPRPGPTPAGAPPAPSAPPASLDDVIARSVDLAYRVIDEYVQKGQRAAERIGSRAYGAGAFTADMQDLSARLVHYASDATSLWLEFVRLAAGAQGVETPSSSAAPANGPAAAAARVVLHVEAHGPTEISLDLRPGAAARTLVIQALRAVEPEKPALEDIRFEPASETTPACVRVRVPPGQPPGGYHGLVIDAETNGPLGALTVRVLDG